MSPVLARALAHERRALLGWIVGMALLVLATVGSWPALAESAEDFNQVLENLPDALVAFAGEGIATFSAAGIVGSRLYGTVGLAIAIGLAVSRGARGIAGEEAGGTLELLVSQPVSRRAIARDKAAAMLIAVGVLVVAELALLLVMMPVVGLDFGLGEVLAAAIGLLLISLLFGAVAFAVGAATGKRGAAVAAGGGGAGALFFLGGLAQLVDVLEPLGQLSPFVHYDGSSVLASGWSLWPALVFAALTVAMLLAGTWAFERRDLQ